MKRVLFVGSLLFLFVACSKRSDINTEALFTAEVTGYDMNCSTCLLAFPYDITEIREEIGESRDNLYHAVNMNETTFTPGQMLKVKVRAAKESELPACITLYPSADYVNVYVSDYQSCRFLKYNTRVDLPYGECLSDPSRNMFICFDSVLTDSRCPTGLMCIWAGEAIARFEFKEYGGEIITADLHVGTVDSVIGSYKFSFTDLSPYPSVEHHPELKEYVATIIVKQK